MAAVYATLITKGYKTINQVPALLRDDVKKILIELDLEELTK